MTQDINAILSEIEVGTAEINRIKKEMVEKLRPKMKDIFLPFLEKWKDKVTTITWTQYTPYFNDGEPCEFSVNTLYAHIIDEDISYYDGTFPINDWYFKERGTDKESDYQKKFWDNLLKLFIDESEAKDCNDDFEKLQKTFSQINEDLLLEVFGDHARIIVTLAGIETEEFDHD